MKLDSRELLAIFFGGFIGAVARAAVADNWVHDPTAWPWATFLVNIVGAFLLGCFITLLQQRRADSPYAQPFLGTGFCGALTTFSTMQLETLRMLDVGAVGLAIAYLAVSVLLGLVAVWLGIRLVHRRRAIV